MGSMSGEVGLHIIIIRGLGLAFRIEGKPGSRWLMGSWNSG